MNHRLRAHSESVMRLAMKILITQISSSRTSYLVEALMDIPPSEMQLLLSSILLFGMKDLEDLSVLLLDQVFVID